MFVVRLKRPNEDFDVKTFKSKKGTLARFRAAQKEMIDGQVEQCALFDAGATDAAGATRVEQVEQNVKAIAWTLSAEDTAEIDGITKG